MLARTPLGLDVGAYGGGSNVLDGHSWSAY